MTKLQDIAQQPFCNDSTKALILDTDRFRSTDIKLEYGHIRQPDEQFHVVGLPFAGLVIETSCTQKARDLCYAADDYLIGSNGNIRTVLGIRTSTGKEKEAEIQLWRPKFTRDNQTEKRTILKSEKSLI